MTLATHIKLSTIEQEHLQELYDAAGVPRDELPYSPALAHLCRDFQDRTFKNASESQVYGALLKYVRSGRPAKVGRPAKGGRPEGGASAGQLEHARLLREQRAAMPRILPYTADFDFARTAFARSGAADLSPGEFWSVVRLADAAAARLRRTAAAAQPAPAV